MASASSGVWVSVSEFARQNGVTPQSMGERVRRLEADGKIETRREGNKKMVLQAALEEALNITGDAVRENAAQVAIDTPKDPALRDAQTRRAEIEADRAKIRLDQERGLVRPVADIEDTAVDVAAGILAELDKIPRLMEAAGLEAGATDQAALRKSGKDIVRKMREAIAARVAELAGPDAGPQKQGGDHSGKEPVNIEALAAT
ncbi:MAG: hypothetical protein AAF762_04805 [Pseudomonadota bacterium]